MERVVRGHDVVFLPMKVVPYCDDVDCASSVSTRYSEAEELVGEGEVETGGEVTTNNELAEQFFRLNLDLVLNGDRDAGMIFSSPEEAGAFKAMYHEGRAAEFPHCVLWDHLGPTTLFDMRCVAKDTVYAIATENQCRKYEDDGVHKYLRLPIRWTLARWTTGNSNVFEPITGLVPTAFLVAKDYYDRNGPLFLAAWFLGDASPSDAHGCLREGEEGDFIIYAPAGINANLSELPEYSMLIVSDEKKKSNRRDPKQQETDTLLKKIVEVVIWRSPIGEYCVFDLEFVTLFDLVAYLSSKDANYSIPRLNIRSKYPVPPAPMPPPLAHQPKRDCMAMPMISYQLASQQYREIVEPAMNRSLLAYFGLDVSTTADGIAKILGRKIGEDTHTSVSVEPPTTPIHATGQLLMTDITVHKNKRLGSGQFGDVYEGTIRGGDAGTNVAVKVQQMKGQWRRELAVMQMIIHPNCVRLLGWTIDGDSLVMCLELMPGGNLENYIKKRLDAGIMISQNDLADLGAQMSRGVAHMHALTPPLVHGDLAARNCLLRPHPTDPCRFVLKVADFGLTKVVPPSAHTYYDDKNTLPFKWTAPEVLLRGEMSPMGDVYSIGIVAMECAGALHPYNDIRPQMLVHYLKDGSRMERLPWQPVWHYAIALDCWKASPIDRPTCSMLVDMFTQHLIDNDAEHKEVWHKWTTAVAADKKKKDDKEARERAELAQPTPKATPVQKSNKAAKAK